jgi:hypothetical protein
MRLPEGPQPRPKWRCSLVQTRLKRLNGHHARDSGELCQELAKRVTAFEVVDQIFERDAGATKAGNSIHDIRIDDDHMFFEHCVYFARLRGNGDARLARFREYRRDGSVARLVF